MKRVICLLLCMVLLIPAAFAAAPVEGELPRLFNAQMITGGVGVRGRASVTASGTASWLEMLLPFTAADVQIRAIGQAQGPESDLLDDDDDWQLLLYAEDAQGQHAGDTYLYSGTDGMYLQSALLPGKLLKVPADGVHLLYDLARGDADSLFFGFDPFDLAGWTSKERPAVYEAIAQVLGVDQATWDAAWAPVMEKYELDMDWWLSRFGKHSNTVQADGSLSMGMTYAIPVDAFKKQAKYVVGAMLNDGALQELLSPLVASEVRAMYLNPSMLYFYEACIDALPLTGDLVLSRQMSVLGEVESTSISLPLPVLPHAFAAAAGQVLADVFALPYEDALDGMTRLVLTQQGDLGSIELQGSKRTITLAVTEANLAETARDMAGTLRITPVVGVNELPLFAAFTLSTSHSLYEDESYDAHDDTSFALTLAPDQTLGGANASVQGTQIDFAPISIAAAVNYRTKPYVENSAVQINITADVAVPDAEVSLDLVLRTTNLLKWPLATLPTTGAMDMTALTEAQQDELRAAFISNAVQTMVSLNGALPTATSAPETEDAAEPDAAATAVPPMGEGE